MNSTTTDQQPEDRPRCQWDGNSHEPDDLPDDGDRCKYCGIDITWIGPSVHNWVAAEAEGTA